MAFDLPVVVEIDGPCAEVGSVENDEPHLVLDLGNILLADIAAEGFDEVVGVPEQIGRAECAIFGQLRIDLEGDRTCHFKVPALQRGEFGALPEQRTCGMNRYLDCTGKLALHALLDGAERIRQWRIVRRSG